MRRDAEDPDPPRRVLYHGQDAGLGTVEQVNREEIDREDGASLRAQELLPGRPGPVPGGTLTLRISQTVDAATLIPRPASSPWILR
jgi:hypothetical protein